MLSKRIIICLDVREGKTTKGIRFKGNVDIGDPVDMAREYYEQGVDELAFMISQHHPMTGESSLMW